MSPEREAELRELLARATPGPWSATHNQHTPIVGPARTTRKGDGKPKPVAGSEEPVVSLGNTAACSDPDCCTDNPIVDVGTNDAALIVALRNAAPALLKLARERVALPVVKSCGTCHGAASRCDGTMICHYTDEFDVALEADWETGAPPAWCPLRHMDGDRTKVLREELERRARP